MDISSKVLYANTSSYITYEYKNIIKLDRVAQLVTYPPRANFTY